MLFTGKGDDGTSKLFGSCPGERISKTSHVFTALGSLDELNSFLGICKVKATQLVTGGFNIKDIIHELQENLFIIQAEIAGADKSITAGKVDDLSKLINDIEKELPEIKSFFIPGGTELASLLDYARSLSRRAERSVLLLEKLEEKSEENSGRKISDSTKAYLNRLSSILYALTRLVNHQAGATEKGPSYN